MSDELAIIDGTQVILEDHHTGRLYELEARVDGAVARTGAAEIGAALNALYAQTLQAILTDPGLGGLTSAIREGQTEGASLEIEITHDPFTGASGFFGLHLVMPFWQPDGAPPRREAILEAFATAVAGNAPTVLVSVREQILEAVRVALAAALGIPILRNAPRPLDTRAASQLAVLIDGDQQADYTADPGRVHYRAQLATEVFVAGTDAVPLDALIQGVLAAFRGAGTLGGLAIDLLEGDTEPSVQRIEYTGPFLAARIRTDVLYATPVGDPYTVG